MTPRTLGQDLLSRLTSRKLWVLVTACSLPWLGLERGVNHLYALEPWQAGVYGTMFLAVMGVIGALVAKYMGIQNVSVGSNISAMGTAAAAISHALDRREEQIIDESARNENLRANRK